jgi:uncharacterized protein YfaS (alpha-2-macroglobulin family)
MANTLISDYATDDTAPGDATYMYLSNKYFDMPPVTPSNAIMEYINDADYNSYTSALLIAAMTTHANDEKLPNISVKSGDKSIDFDTNTDNTIITLDENTDKLTIECDTCSNDTPVFFATIQSGYPTKETAHSNGIEIIREYYNENGDRVSSANLGDTLTAKVSVRATRGNVPNVAIVDLLTGGMTARDLDAPSAEHYEIRTDRVLIFTDLTRTPVEFTYTVQLTAAGTFAIPSVSAMSMYNPDTSATYTPFSPTFTVSNAQLD